MNHPRFKVRLWPAFAAVKFTVAAANIEQQPMVTVSNQFELSTDNKRFIKTLTLSGTGNVPASLIYIRLAATAPAGAWSGTITVNAGTVTGCLSLPPC